MTLSFNVYWAGEILTIEYTHFKCSLVQFSGKIQFLLTWENDPDIIALI